MASEVVSARETAPRSLENILGGRRTTENHRLYQAYSTDPNYRDVVYDAATGGMMATHVGHNWQHDPNDKARYFGNMTKEDLERECQLEIVRMGGSVIFRDESQKRANGQTATALDAVINGHLTDIRSVTSQGRNYKNQLESKNEQLKDWNSENPRNKARTITLYFHDPSMYSGEQVRESIRGLQKTWRHGRRVRLQFNRVLAVVKGSDRIEEFRV